MSNKVMHPSHAKGKWPNFGLEALIKKKKKKGIKLGTLGFDLLKGLKNNASEKSMHRIKAAYLPKHYVLKRNRRC